MSIGGRRIGRGVAIAVVALLIAGLGFAIGSVLGTRTEVASEEGAGVSAPEAGAPGVVDGSDLAAPDKPLPDESASRSAGGTLADGDATDPLVIRNAALEVRVETVEDGIDAVRAAARRHGAEITDLSVQSDSDIPRPLAEGDSSFPSPATAFVTLRVPADRLDALQNDVSDAGDVLSQSASSTDVTEQHVDLSARLRNLKAEEARLRSFFDRATRVSDLLAIERELARVRGEIEAMQAQIDFLDRQVARATLTVTLSEPGPVVRPGGVDWGIRDAITRGIQAAAALISTMITGIIALLPVLAIALVAWLIARWAGRRRRESRLGWGRPEASEQSPEDETRA